MAQNGSNSPPFPPKMSKNILIRVNSTGVSMPVILLQLNARLLVPQYVLAALGGSHLTIFANILLFRGKCLKKGVRGKTIDSETT